MAGTCVGVLVAGGAWIVVGLSIVGVGRAMCVWRGREIEERPGRGQVGRRGMGPDVGPGWRLERKEVGREKGRVAFWGSS